MSALSDRIARLVADAIAGDDVYCELQDVIREVDALCAPVGVEGRQLIADAAALIGVAIANAEVVGGTRATIHLTRAKEMQGRLHRALAKQPSVAPDGREGMSGHTPGPWSVGAEDADSGQIEVISEARPYVCMVLPGGIDGTTAANARLIAAAPEMLQMLRYCSEWLQGSEPHRARAVNEVIAKATGAQQ